MSATSKATVKPRTSITDINPISAREYLYDLYFRNRGLLLIGCSAFTGSVMMVVVKLLTNQDADVSDEDRQKDHIDPLEMIAVRMAITWSLCEAWMIHDKVPYPFLGPPGLRWWLTLRGVAGFFGLFGAYYAVQYLALSDCTTIGFLTPFVTAFLGRVILKENFSKKEAYAAIISFLGVLLIARPSFLFGHPHTPAHPSDANHHQTQAGSADGGVGTGLGSGGFLNLTASDRVRLTAVFVQLLGVAGAALAYIAMRRVGHEAHVMHSIAYFNGWSFVAALVGSLLGKTKWIWPDWKWCIGLLAIGLLGFTGQVVSTRGFQMETAGRGTLALYVSIVFSLFFERLIFHHQPTFLSYLGILIILSSAIFVAVSKEAAPRTIARTVDEEVGLMDMQDTEIDDDDRTLRDSDDCDGHATQVFDSKEAKRPE